MAAAAPTPSAPKQKSYNDKDKPSEVRKSNIVAAKGTTNYPLGINLDQPLTTDSNLIFCPVAVADAVKTSLGPKGMDKMIKDE